MKLENFYVFLHFIVLSDYLQAVLNFYQDNSGKLDLIPVNCGYLLTNQIMFVIKNGVIVEDAQKNIDYLKTIYVEYNNFINECLVISINGTDKEVWFGWR